MKFSQKLLISIFFIVAGMFILVPLVNAFCELVDPIEGNIVFTCKKEAHLSISGNGTRYLPLPAEVKRGTTLTVDWVAPFTKNTWLTSWDTENQTTRFWKRDDKKSDWWINPENATIQPLGEFPSVRIKAKRMPDGTLGWAIIQATDVLIWNGGN